MLAAADELSPERDEGVSLMKACPYCLAEIPDAARKCQHCGEWVDRPPAATPAPQFDRSTGEEFGRIADKFITYKLVTGIIGLIVFLLFFLLFWLPGFNGIRNGMQFPQQPTFQMHP